MHACECVTILGPLCKEGYPSFAGNLEWNIQGCVCVCICGVFIGGSFILFNMETPNKLFGLLGKMNDLVSDG